MDTGLQAVTDPQVHIDPEGDMQGWELAGGPSTSNAYCAKGLSGSEAPDMGGCPGGAWAPEENGVVSAQ